MKKSRIQPSAVFRAFQPRKTAGYPACVNSTAAAPPFFIFLSSITCFSLAAFSSFLCSSCILSHFRNTTPFSATISREFLLTLLYSCLLSCICMYIITCMYVCTHILPAHTDILHEDSPLSVAVVVFFDSLAVHTFSWYYMRHFACTCMKYAVHVCKHICIHACVVPKTRPRKSHSLLFAHGSHLLTLTLPFQLLSHILVRIRIRIHPCQFHARTRYKIHALAHTARG